MLSDWSQSGTSSWRWQQLPRLLGMTKLTAYSRPWNVAVWTLFFTRGIFWGVWASQTPAIKQALNLSLSQVSLYSMLFSIGSISAVFIGGRLIARFGSRAISLTVYVAAAAGLVGLALIVLGQATDLVFILIAILGLPIGIADLDNNLQATELNRASGRNLVPSLHGGFSVGVLIGSAVAGFWFSQYVPTPSQLLIAATVIGASSALAALLIPRANGRSSQQNLHKAEMGFVGRFDIWKEKRTMQLAVIAFAFVFSEAAVTNWIPLALVQQGFDKSAAAIGYTAFGLGMAAMRISGNKVADLLGRRRVIIGSVIFTSLGEIWFIFSPLVGGQYFAITLWGLGTAIALAMVFAAAGDNQARMGKRVNIIVGVTYLANVVTGPIISGIASVTGIVTAFFISLIFVLVAAFFSRAVDPERVAA